MLTKNKFLKIIFPICAVLLTALVFILIFCLPKEKTEKLSISANNLNLIVNEEKDVSYIVNNPYSIVKIEISNTAIAKINGNTIIALKVGTTEINFKAIYKNQTAECSATITVKTKTTTDETEPTTPDEPDTPTIPDEPDIPVNPDEPDVPVINELDFEIINQSGCIIEGHNITLIKNSTSFFRISITSQEIYSYTLSTTIGITVSKVDFGANTWQISASQSGQVYIIINEEIKGTINITVN